MEKSKATKSSKNKFLGFLPKAAVSFQNPIFSPGKDMRSDGLNSKKGKAPLSRVFSGPIMFLIPAEARSAKSKNSNFDTQEPTSPKISCMGQIKHRKKLCKNKYVSLAKEFVPRSKPIGPPTGKPERKKSDASIDHFRKPPLPDRAPSISQMKRFASSKESHGLVNFDWRTAQVAPDESEYCSDGEEYEVMIPFSAPLLVAGGGCGGGGRVAVEPRKEINLWKRRTMAQPKPLRLDIVRAY